jgi:hypothetical protein
MSRLGALETMVTGTESAILMGLDQNGQVR